MRSDEFWGWFDGHAAPKLKGRDKTFRKMFEHLDSVGGRGPVRIVETGCLEEPDNWAGNGCSSILFDRYAQTHPGSTLWSVDIVPKKVDLTRSLVGPCSTVLCGDSVEALKQWAAAGSPIDLLYLDASHLDWNHAVPAQLHHLNELMAAMPMLRGGTLVAVDDAPTVMDEFPRLEIGGKGALVAKYAFTVGADLQFLEYQVGWTGMTRRPFADDPSVEDLIARARAHVEADRMVAADPLYRLVLELTLAPDTPVKRVARGEACMHFAKVSLSKERRGTAADWYREALRADPAAVEYRIDLATKCYYEMNAIDLALSEAVRATRIEPGNAEAWHALGALWHEKGELRRAAEAYDKELLLASDATAALNRATVALDMEEYDLVRELCAKVMGSDRAGDALHIAAMAAYREDRHEEAIALFDDALAMGCRDPELARWHKSTAMECLGMYPQAWAERERRANQTKRPQLALPYKRFGRPLWDGSPAPGKRLHVHAEAGAGDNIAMMRYLPQLAEMGFRVTYEAADDLRDLARESFPMVEVVDKALDYPGTLGLKDFDLHVPIGGLQHAFRATYENPGWRGPYVRADAAKAAAFEEWLKEGALRRVGLCWSSGIRLGESAWLERYGRQKSMCFEQIVDVATGRRGLRFASLQVGPERAQNDAPYVRDLLPEKPNWTDTAALISCLDLVITVDTAVAHLAGAMGKPVWVMVPVGAGGSWHWMSKRPGALWNERSPWYPSARVFRQRTPGDWAGVVAEIGAALAGELGDG